MRDDRAEPVRRLAVDHGQHHEPSGFRKRLAAAIARPDRGLLRVEPGHDKPRVVTDVLRRTDNKRDRGERKPGGAVPRIADDPAAAIVWWDLSARDEHTRCLRWRCSLWHCQPSRLCNRMLRRATGDERERSGHDREARERSALAHQHSTSRRSDSAWRNSYSDSPRRNKRRRCSPMRSCISSRPRRRGSGRGNSLGTRTSGRSRSRRR